MCISRINNFKYTNSIISAICHCSSFVFSVSLCVSTYKYWKGAKDCDETWIEEFMASVFSENCFSCLFMVMIPVTFLLFWTFEEKMKDKYLEKPSRLLLAFYLLLKCSSYFCSWGHGNYRIYFIIQWVAPLVRYN